MESKKNIYQKLCYVQRNLKVPKSQFNQFGKYSYRNCEDIQEALKTPYARGRSCFSYQ